MMVLSPFGFFQREARRWTRIASQIGGLVTGKPGRKVVRVAFHDKQKSILSKLTYLYGPEKGGLAFKEIEQLMQSFIREKPAKLKKKDASFRPIDRFTEKDVILIAYPDMVQREGEKPLATLKKFADSRLKGVISTIHILPFYPYSSDRGFSVKNYAWVNQDFGNWRDITALSENFDLMFDAVFNHASVKGRWFKGFLKGEPRFQNFFISYPSRDALTQEQLSRIIRPRTSELLTKFRAKHGDLYAWTTFGPDQADLNYKEPRVLLEIIDTLLLYVCHGATEVRLDAVNYIWKEPGTSCVHLRQTHIIIQLMRDVLDIVAPSVSLITETNVPHAKNISYLGNGSNEAQMVYNFTLPPLVLHAIYKGNCRFLSKWASRLKYEEYATYFNFLASHDGIGLTPAQRVLPKKEVEFLVSEAKRHGSLVLNKKIKGTKEVPYELNITWWNAVNRQDDTFQLERYLASRAIALSLRGVPGIYLHSLLGTKNDNDAVARSKVTRDINRKNLKLDELEAELGSETYARQVFERLTRLIAVRRAEKAFHPAGPQKILAANDSVFSLIRLSPDQKEKVLCLVNVTGQDQEYLVDCVEIGLNPKGLYDILSGQALGSERITPRQFYIRLKPYEVAWIKSRP